MAWRIARSHSNSLRHIEDSPDGYNFWTDAIQDAYRLIRHANTWRHILHEAAQPNPRYEHAEKTIHTLATHDEYWGQHFTFERGCQLITGKRKDDAIALFRRACERGYLPINQKRLKELETNGFPWDEDMIQLRVSFIRIPKPKLRKNSPEAQSSDYFFE